MPDSSSNLLGLPTSTWITLAVAAVGLFAFKQYGFRDTRPSDLWVPTYSHLISQDQDVEARLWQDPLTAVETAIKLDDAHTAVAPPAVLGPGKKSGALEQARTCEQKISDSRSTTPSGTGRAASGRDNGPLPHTPDFLCHSIGMKAQNGPVLIVGAMVSGAPYSADIESRRRARYAVQAGLYRSGYMPVNNQHVGYVQLGHFYEDASRSHDLAVYEWFVSNSCGSEKKTCHVLLLWLDQDGFRDAPIAQLARIADGLFPSKLPIALLGPADSDGLRAIADEADKPGIPGDTPLAQWLAAREKANSATWNIKIYSPWATVPDALIASGLRPQRWDRFSVPGAEVSLYRTVSQDSLVAGIVQEELRARGIDLGELAIVAERDTVYGRSIGGYFGGCRNGPHDDLDPQEDHKPLPSCLTYLKGLDGVGPPPPKQSASSSNASTTADTKTTDSVTRPDSLSEASTGPRQLDYLRRMGLRLLAMQMGPAHSICKPKESDCKPRFIRAIGVLGTDIYDKILVLQELRPMFPDAVFFTFGLDALYTDSDSSPWTHQLLVGSTLGLSLRSDLQGDIPAFRDSYQAATFYSTRLLLHRAMLPTSTSALSSISGLQWTQSPMLFEIGRKQPIDLNFDQHDHERCDFDGVCASISATRSEAFNAAVTQKSASWFVLLIPLCIGLLMRLALGADAMHGPRLGNRFITLTNIIGMLAIVGAMLIQLTAPWKEIFDLITRNQTHMPVPIADGASHWGKELLEACLLPLIVALLIRGQRKLTENVEAIRIEFDLPQEHDVLTDAYKNYVRTAHCGMVEWLYFPVLSPKVDQTLAVPGGISELEWLIARYLYRGAWPRRWFRVAVMTALFIFALRFFEWLGFSVFSDVPWILTHSSKHGLEGMIAFLAFTLVQLLIFWVIDAILLTRAFLLDLASCAPDWPGTSKPLKELVLPGGISETWLGMRLIARRTTWVSGFIWYPSIVLAGMFGATFTLEYGRYQFDNNPVTFVASVALIVAAVVSLRQAAESWRAKTLQNLSHERLAGSKWAAAGTDVDAKLNVLSGLVVGLDEGAFATYSQQPLVRAVLLPAITFVATAGIPFLHPS